uniref:HAMP domain-containing sensor histidine kinase n=1 Tax=Acetatifactor sp. TaxID=1872090 RepID=UPI0040564919
MKKTFRMKKGIFQKLVISYIVFSIVLLSGFVATLLISAVTITSGDTNTLCPYEVVDSEGNITNLETVTNLDGWIEELDENYKVINVYGEKKTEQVKYTQEEIYYITRMKQGDDKEYIGFMNPVVKKKRYFLVIYATNVMQVETSIILDPASSGSNQWFAFAMMVFGMIYLASCLLLSLYLRRKIKKPLDKLIDGMEQVQEGKTNVVLDFKTEVEFEKIRDTFNRMANQLEQEKKEKQDAIRKKNHLILELSHDIKTPIATIKSYANALEAGLVPAEKIQDYYHTIDLKADRITNLSEDMFMLLKMENPDYILQLRKTDLSELLRKICVEYYEELTESGFEFDIDIPEQACMTMLDARLFTRVISNLLTNAKKYNRLGNYIGLRMQLIEEGFEIDVLDDGEALNEELVMDLFEAFVRGDKARKSDGGTGLGLAISRAIMQKHKGSIGYQRVDDKNCFSVWIKKR